MHNDLIPEQDAANRCGVSTRTLERFVETGHLRVERGDDGAISYRARTLAAIFGVTFENPLEPLPQLEQVGDNLMATSQAEPIVRELPMADESEIREPDERLEKEILRLKNISDMQEKLLEIREEQIAELKEQRLWLQNRIERLEQAASEDRILLLASSETARRLASKERRSPIRALLEWAGVTPALPAENDKSNSILQIR